MKILQIFGAVVAVHLLAFIFIFASPGCQSSPRNVPTPDATLPTASSPPAAEAAPEMAPAAGTTTYAPELAPGRAEPTRPGSPNAAAIVPPKPVMEKVEPVSTYTVQRGDSLWSISKKHHLTVGELAKANNLGAGAVLQPGKKLIIPGKPAPAAVDLATTPVTAKPAAAEPALPAHTAGVESIKHTVQPGESLKSIAHKYGVKAGDLAAANSIANPNMLRAGQELVIPMAKTNGKTGKAPAKAAPAAAATEKPAPAATDASLTPHFEIKAPPANQDLDSGLKPGGTTDVPTIKVEDVKTDDTDKK